MASDVVSCVDEVRHVDRFRAETQVRNRYAAGFLGVISEVCLSIHIRVVADDLDSRLVSADRAVRAEAPEFASRKARRVKRHLRCARKGQVRNVVFDAEGEAVERMFFLEFREYGQDVFRQNVFGAQAGAPPITSILRPSSFTKPTISRYRGSPREPGSFVRSITAIFLTVFGNTLRRYLLENGR